MKAKAFLLSLMVACLSADAQICCGLKLSPLHDLVLPAIAFTNASMSTVAQTLEREFDAVCKESRAPRMNFLAHPFCTNLLVSFKTRDVSVETTLLLLKEMFDVNHMIIGDNIVLTCQRGGPMVDKIYNVIPTAFHPDGPDGVDAMRFFSRLGVEFPEGASACYLPGHGKLVVRNHPDNLETLEALLALLNFPSRQIETSLRVVRLKDPELAARAARATEPMNVQDVIQASSTLFYLTSISASGGTVTQSVTSATVAHKTGRKADGSATIVMTPFVVPGYGSVSIFLELDAALAFPSGADTRIEYALKTSLTLASGADILLWMSPPAGEGGDLPLIGLVLSARYVDDAGQPVAPPTDSAE